MQIFVQLLTGKTITITTTARDKIDNVKTKVHDKMTTDDDTTLTTVDDFNLTFGGKKLLPRKCIGDYGIMHEQTIFVTKVLAGGAPPSAKRARIDLSQVKALPDDVAAVKELFAANTWEPRRWLAELSQQQLRQYLTTLETRRTTEQQAEATVMMTAKFMALKAELHVSISNFMDGCIK